MKRSDVGTPAIILDDSVNDAHAEVWFAEPAGFSVIPIDALLPEPGSSAAEALHGITAPFLASAPNEMARQRFITHVTSAQMLLGALREVGTVHCSLGLHCDEVPKSIEGNSEPLLSFLTLSWRETSTASRAAIAARAVTGVAGHANVAYEELPCGPVTFSETLRMPKTDGRYLPQQPLLQFHAHLPHPECNRLAVMSISTTAGHRRTEYRTILRWVAETVRFENPLSSTDG